MHFETGSELGTEGSETGLPSQGADALESGSSSCSVSSHETWAQVVDDEPESGSKCSSQDNISQQGAGEGEPACLELGSLQQEGDGTSGSLSESDASANLSTAQPESEGKNVAAAREEEDLTGRVEEEPVTGTEGAACISSEQHEADGLSRSSSGGSAKLTVQPESEGNNLPGRKEGSLTGGEEESSTGGEEDNLSEREGEHVTERVREHVTTREEAADGLSSSSSGESPKVTPEPETAGNNVIGRGEEKLARRDEEDLIEREEGHVAGREEEDEDAKEIEEKNATEGHDAAGLSRCSSDARANLIAQPEWEGNNSTEREVEKLTGTEDEKGREWEAENVIQSEEAACVQVGSPLHDGLSKSSSDVSANLNAQPERGVKNLTESVVENLRISGNETEWEEKNWKGREEDNVAEWEEEDLPERKRSRLQHPFFSGLVLALWIWLRSSNSISWNLC